MSEWKLLFPQHFFVCKLYIHLLLGKMCSQHTPNKKKSCSSLCMLTFFPFWRKICTYIYLYVYLFIYFILFFIFIWRMLSITEFFRETIFSVLCSILTLPLMSDYYYYFIVPINFSSPSISLHFVDQYG